MPLTQASHYRQGNTRISESRWAEVVSTCSAVTLRPGAAPLTSRTRKCAAGGSAQRPPRCGRALLRSPPPLARGCMKPPGTPARPATSTTVQLTHSRSSPASMPSAVVHAQQLSTDVGMLALVSRSGVLPSVDWKSAPVSGSSKIVCTSHGTTFDGMPLHLRHSLCHHVSAVSGKLASSFGFLSTA